jgi:hypothetical protein
MDTDVAKVSARRRRRAASPPSALPNHAQDLNARDWHAGPVGTEQLAVTSAAAAPRGGSRGQMIAAAVRRSSRIAGEMPSVTHAETRPRKRVARRLHEDGDGVCDAAPGEMHVHMAVVWCCVHGLLCSAVTSMPCAGRVFIPADGSAGVVATLPELPPPCVVAAATTAAPLPPSTSPSPSVSPARAGAASCRRDALPPLPASPAACRATAATAAMDASSGMDATMMWARALRDREHVHMVTALRVTGGTRATMLERMMRVCSEFKLRRETFHLAVNYCDRFLASVSDHACRLGRCDDIGMDASSSSSSSLNHRRRCVITAGVAAAGELHGRISHSHGRTGFHLSRREDRGRSRTLRVAATTHAHSCGACASVRPCVCALHPCVWEQEVNPIQMSELGLSDEDDGFCSVSDLELTETCMLTVRTRACGSHRSCAPHPGCGLHVLSSVSSSPPDSNRSHYSLSSTRFACTRAIACNALARFVTLCFDLLICLRVSAVCAHRRWTLS